MVTPLGFVYKKMNSSTITQTVPLECTHLNGHTRFFYKKINSPPTAITQAVPLECTYLNGDTLGFV